MRSTHCGKRALVATWFTMILAASCAATRVRTNYLPGSPFDPNMVGKQD